MAKSENCSIDMSSNMCQDDNFYEQKPLTSSERCPSQSSSLHSNTGDICRICRCEGISDSPLIAPCYCCGSLRYVHQKCLHHWVKLSKKLYCELCQFQFITKTKMKPFKEWKYLGIMTRSERAILLAWLVLCIGVLESIFVLCVIVYMIDRIPLWSSYPLYIVPFIIEIYLIYAIIYILSPLRKIKFNFWKRWIVYNSFIYIQDASGEMNATSDRDTTEIRCSSKPIDSSKSHLDNKPETNQFDIKIDQFQVKSPIKKADEGKEFYEEKPVEKSLRYQSQSSNSNSGAVCRICHREGVADSTLGVACLCRGSQKYVHYNCLQQWMKWSTKRNCELCNFKFITRNEIFCSLTPEHRILGCWTILCIALILLTSSWNLVLDDTERDAHQKGNSLLGIGMMFIILIASVVHLLIITIALFFQELKLDYHKRETNVREVPEESRTSSDRDATEVRCSLKPAGSMKNKTEKNFINVKTNRSRIWKEKVIFEIDDDFSVELDCANVADL